MNKSKKLIMLVKTIFLSIYVIVFVVLVVLQLWLQLAGYNLSLSPILYWIVLIGWIALLINFRWSSRISLLVAFVLFIISALVTTAGINSFGETVMRVSLIGWLVGIGQALVEYKKENDKKSP